MAVLMFSGWLLKSGLTTMTRKSNFMNHQKNYCNRSRDRGGQYDPPPRSIKLVIGARAVRVKRSPLIFRHFKNKKELKENYNSLLL